MQNKIILSLLLCSTFFIKDLHDIPQGILTTFTDDNKIRELTNSVNNRVRELTIFFFDNLHCEQNVTIK